MISRRSSVILHAATRERLQRSVQVFTERAQILIQHPEAGTLLDELREGGWHKLIYRRWKNYRCPSRAVATATRLWVAGALALSAVLVSQLRKRSRAGGEDSRVCSSFAKATADRKLLVVSDSELSRAEQPRATPPKRRMIGSISRGRTLLSLFPTAHPACLYYVQRRCEAR